MAEKNNKHPYWLIACIVIATIIGSTFIIVREINRPARHDSEVATKIAKKNTDLKHVDRVTRFVYNKVEYTVSGTKADGTSIFVVITDDGKKATVYKQSAGISEQKAIADVQKDSNLKKITSSRFGIIKDQPAWMISYINQKNKLITKTINFKTGKEIKTVSTY
jgi:uncharacterized protein YpmB